MGTIRLTGERRFTAVSAHRVRGTLTRTFDEVCRDEDGGRGDDQKTPWSLLDAATRRGRAQIHFGVTKFEGSTTRLGWPDTIIFSASAWSFRPRMTVLRSATFSPRKAHGFTIADLATLESATVDPPAPFVGSATYGLNPDGSASWTGTLSVELPGMGSVSLTGPRFEAGLCHLRRCTGDDLVHTTVTTSRRR